MTVDRSLNLPEGYQHYDWSWDDSVTLDDPDELERDMRELHGQLLLYTQHQIFLEDGVSKHTRSSPNWDGGLVTFATCKHLVRSYARVWAKTWLVGLCPAHLASNTLMFAGRIDEVFDSNYDLSRAVKNIGRSVYDAKSALLNPRGDLYEPTMNLFGDEKFEHRHYESPPNHTRSLEFYDKSPGSQTGLVPKWWRDVEYTIHGRRPKVFILRPCHIFSKPSAWTDIKPGRATRSIDTVEFVKSMRRTEL